MPTKRAYRAVPVGHRVGIPWLAACLVREERERVFWDLDADGPRLCAAALDAFQVCAAGCSVGRYGPRPRLLVLSGARRTAPDV